MSKSYSALPSQLLGIDDKLAAYQFDRAVSILGNKIDAALFENERKKKPLPAESIIKRLLSGKEDPKTHASLASRATKVIKLKPGQDPLEVL